MNKSTLKPFIYGLAGLACMLFSSLGYVAGHKYFSAAQILGMSASLWQVLVAVLVIAAAGGIGESLLKFLDIDELIRAGLTAAAGLIVLAVTILAWGSLVGTNSIFFGIFIVAINAIFYKNILAWFKNFGQLSATISGKPAKIIAASVILILGGNFWWHWRRLSSGIRSYIITQSQAPISISAGLLTCLTPCSGECPN